MKTARALAAAALLLLALRPGARAASAGADPFQFLFLDANARAVGLGGAYTALASDANALLYNPAGLGRLGSSQATFMHNQYFQGVKQEYLAVAGKCGWSLSANSLDFGDVPRTTLSNPSGAGLGSVGMKDLAVGAGYGFALGEHLALGVGAKYIHESIAGLSAQGWGLDAGVMLTAGPLTLGAAAQNFGQAVQFQGVSEDLPLAYRAGAALRLDVLGQRLTLAAQAMKQQKGALRYAGGVEAQLAGALALRAGYDSRNTAGPGLTAGLGLGLGRLSADYAFVPYGDLGSSHRFSLTWSW